MGAVSESVFKLLDYRGDITKNKESCISSYSKDFSPNNIKRVVISADGVLVQLHKKVPNYGYSIGRVCYNIISFKPDTLRREQIEPKYKPILSLFASKNIFSAVEEIILLSNPVNAGSGDINYENNVSYMVAGYNGQGDLFDKVKGRFRRLRYYTVLNTDWANFLVMLQKNRGQFLDVDYIAESQFFAGVLANKIELNSEKDAKTAITINPTYEFDSQLKSYFEGIRDDYLAGKKKEKVEAFKKEHNESKIKEANECIKEYKNFIRVCQRYKKVVVSVGTNGVVPQELLALHISFKPVYRFDGICSVPENLLAKGKPFDEAIKENEENCKKVKLDVHNAIANILFKALGSLCNSENQFTLASLINFEERTIKVPQESETVVNKLYSLFDTKFEGKRFDAKDLKASLTNCLWIICFLFLDRDSDSYKTDYITREYWEGVLKND